MIAAVFLLQSIRVNVSNDSSSPIFYSPSTTSNKAPISIEFFEPGHYKVVINEYEVPKDFGSGIPCHCLANDQ